MPEHGHSSLGGLLAATLLGRMRQFISIDVNHPMPVGPSTFLGTSDLLLQAQTLCIPLWDTLAVCMVLCGPDLFEYESIFLPLKI